MWGHHDNFMHHMHHRKMKLCMMMAFVGAMCIITRMMIIGGVIAHMASRCGMHRGGGMHHCSECGKYHQ